MGRKIIVVDGEPVVRRAVQAILEGAGYKVSATDDVQRLLEACEADPPDLVLTNVMLPGITGHEALKLIKTKCPKVPVLMVSGLPSQPVIQQWIREDGFDVFPKPFLAGALIAKVQEVLGGA